MNSMDFGFCYRIAFECIGKENGIERMVREIAKRTRATVVITNIYGEIVEECDQLHLRTGEEDYDCEIRRMVLYELENKEQAPVSRFSAEMVMRPIEVKHNVEGFAAVLFQNTEEKEEYLEVVKIIVKVAAIEFENHGDQTWCSISMERQIVSQMILGGKSTAGTDHQMQEKMEQLYLIPGFVLGIIWCPDRECQGRLQSIRNQIYEKDQKLLSYLSGNRLYLLFTGRKETEGIKQLLKEVSTSLKVRICMGNLFFDKAEIQSRKKFLEKTLTIGTKMDYETDFFQEEDWFLQTICSYASEKTGFRGYYCEALDRLRREDLQKGTDFYISLKKYLLAGNNVSTAAKALFVHRNTMIYRLQKINELLKINLNDPDTARTLLVSMILQELIDKNDKKVDEAGDLR